MGANEMIRVARDFISSERGVIAPLSISEEELNPTLQDDLSLEAVPLESTSQCYPVRYNFPGDSSCSEFSFFEDGRQRTVQIGFIPSLIANVNILIPVHFFVVAAVILVRENGQLKVWGAPEVQTGILVEKSLVPDQGVLSRYEYMGLRVIDTSAAHGGDYYQLRRQALDEAKKLRLQVEDVLIAKWAESHEAETQFLIVDGTLMNLRNERNVERCVGVSKSFGSRYFDVSEHNRIMGMKEFERSWTFRFHSGDDSEDDRRYGSRERLSWYLRLRSRPNTDPEFGLIRVEMSQHYIERFEHCAERFSRSLLSERLPTSYPAPRWDKHLYPIRACESYLSSIIPSLSTINAAMRG